MVERFTTTVASNGTNNVARKTANRTVLPGKRRNANAYADSTAVTSWAMVTMTDTTSEFHMARPRLPSVHASRSVSVVMSVGSSGCCSNLLPGFRAAMTIT